MKSKTITQNILFATLLASIFYLASCGTKDDTGPCPEEDWEYGITRLNSDYDSLFPYDGSQTTLAYVYSNDTIENDTLIFTLQEVGDTLEITDNQTGGEGGKCTVFADEVKRYYYLSNNTRLNVKMEAVFYDKERMGVVFKPLNKYGNSISNSVHTGGILGSLYMSDTSSNMFKSIKINFTTYQYVYIATGYYDEYNSSNTSCYGDSVVCMYSSREGLIYLHTSCTNETYKYLKR